MRRFLLVASLCALGAEASADPPPPRPPPRLVAPRLELAVAPPPSVTAQVVVPAPRLRWARAPQPSFGLWTASVDAGGGPMFAPAGTPLSAGGFELGASGGWGPTRFVELRLRASIFAQPDRAVDQDADQVDDVDEKNLLGMFLGGGLRLRLPLYVGIDEGSATRFVLFSEGLAGLQPLFGYGDVVSSGPAFELTNGVSIAHVRRRDGLTRGVDLFVRYRQGLGDGNEDLYAVVFGLGYTTEWSAFVPAVPPPEPVRIRRRGVRWTAPVTIEATGGGEVGATFFREEPPGEPLGFSLRMGGECAAGQGWHVAKTIGWAPWRILELQLRTSYFSIDVSEDVAVRDEPNVHGFFGGLGPRLHLYSDAGTRVGLWAAANVGWAQVAAAPEDHDGSGLALHTAIGASLGGGNFPYSATEVSFFLGRQSGLSGNDPDIGMWMAGLAFDFELGPHAPRRPDRALPMPPPLPAPAPAPARDPLPMPEPSRPPPEPLVVQPTRTELTIVPLRPARPWPVGFAVGVDVGGAYYPQRLAGGFQGSGLALGLGVGFVASPYFELRSRVGLVTRSDAVESGGDDVEAVTLTGGPRFRIPIRTVKDNQIALTIEALGGWVTTTDAAGSSLGSGAVLEGAIGVRLPARGGLTAAARGVFPLAEEARGLASMQLTLGGELELGPRFGRPVELPEIPRVEVPERVEVGVRGSAQ